VTSSMNHTRKMGKASGKMNYFFEVRIGLKMLELVGTPFSIRKMGSFFHGERAGAR
jgi:hypothetical protein